MPGCIKRGEIDLLVIAVAVEIKQGSNKKHAPEN